MPFIFPKAITMTARGKQAEKGERRKLRGGRWYQGEGGDTASLRRHARRSSLRVAYHRLALLSSSVYVCVGCVCVVCVCVVRVCVFVGCVAACRGTLWSNISMHFCPCAYVQI